MASTEARSSNGRRFARAANMELDFDQPTTIEGYVLTGTGRQALRRLVPAIQKSSTSRAWSLTGPYGTGKSAFALYLSALLTPQKSTASQQAQRLLNETDPDLAQSLLGRSKSTSPRLAPIPVTGTNEPIPVALLRGLERALNHSSSGSGGKAATKLRTAQNAARGGKKIGSSQILELFDSTLEHLCSSKGTDGAFLVVDELGRLLEYANHRPEESDLAVLQDLAENASRSRRPFLMMTIRHQSLSAYSSNLSPSRRVEWEKIQGRFEDIEFIEPADEMLRLLARAMQTSPSDLARGTDVQFENLVKQAWQLGIAPPNLKKVEFVELLRMCYPLHPLIATLLGFVFRRLGQNERSAFSFLHSNEPYGLQDFLRQRTSAAGSLYSAPRLYDYLAHTLREALYTSSRAKHWAEIETVLDQLTSATDVEANIVKSIGLIGALNATEQLRATRDVVSFSMADVVAATACNKSVSALIDRSVIVDRQYNKTLALWEGSDVDIDAELLVARDKLNGTSSVVELASRFFQTRPIVAKRHSFQTGSLRYFPVSFCSVDGVDERSAGSEHLLISIVLASNASDLERVVEKVRKQVAPIHQGQLFCIAPGVKDFTSLIRDLAALEWVKDHVKPLEGDRTARRELTLRIEGVRRLLGEQLDEILNPENTSDQRSRWFRGGKEIALESGQGLQYLLSLTCDELYCSSPRILNELINRRELSSAAAAARRNLIERMFQSANQPELGIEGTPPEKSMYLSLLLAGGLHRKVKDAWGFHSPAKNAAPNLRAAWEEIIRFFKDSESGAKPISELFTRLSAPPFGILEGPMPILLCSALLTHEHDIALYKDGTFISSPSTPDFELLMKQPNRYTVQRWRVTGVRAEIFQRLAMILGRELPDTAVGKSEILGLIKPLLRFCKGLNDFALFTRRIPDEAAAIREVLQNASEPDSMLFSDLPKACGVKPFPSVASSSNRRVDEFVERLRVGLRELQCAYSKLLDSVFDSVQTAFGIAGDRNAVRKSLTQRAVLMAKGCGNSTLDSFISRILQPELDDTEWLEAIAGVVMIKPAPKWRDMDLDRFRHEIRSMSRLFQHVESLLTSPESKGHESAVETVRIGITTADAADFERVVRLTKEQSDVVNQLEIGVQAALKQVTSADKKDIGLAALARVARKLLD